MAISVDIPESILAYGRVDLSSGQTAMSQHFLNRTNVGAFIEKIRGKGMTKLMRMQSGDSQLSGIFLHPVSDAAIGERTAPGIAEEGAVGRP